MSNELSLAFYKTTLYFWLTQEPQTVKESGTSLVIMETNSKRLAVLVGCNYANTENELHGCINDVLAIRDVLVKRFSFELSNIELLTDAQGSPVKPTGANIKAALVRMIEKAGAGDVLYFHFSGHGTRIPSGKDEAIVPSDFNLITDVDFRQLVNRLPKGASFTMVSDSCHSGGLIDKEKEQVGPTSAHKKRKHTKSSYKPRCIQFESVLQQVASQTQMDTSDISTLLLQFFGEDASLKFRLPSIQLDLLRLLKPDDGVLLSGCQSDETSADMSPGEEGGKAYGAFSNAIETVLEKHPGKVSNRELVMQARELLVEQGFDQHPCLYSSDKSADAIFLSQLF